MKSRSDAQPGRLGAAKCTCGRQSVTKMMKPAFSGTNKRDFEVLLLERTRLAEYGL